MWFCVRGARDGGAARSSACTYHITAIQTSPNFPRLTLSQRDHIFVFFFTETRTVNCLNVFHKSGYTYEFRTRGPNKNTYLTICRETRRTINKCVRSLLTLRLKLIKFGIAARASGHAAVRRRGGAARDNVPRQYPLHRGYSSRILVQY